jgi:hypothetical protein
VISWVSNFAAFNVLAFNVSCRLYCSAVLGRDAAYSVFEIFQESAARFHSSKEVELEVGAVLIQVEFLVDRMNVGKKKKMQVEFSRPIAYSLKAPGFNP